METANIVWPATPMLCRHPTVVNVLHGWCWARWTHVYITMNRKAGDYDLYPEHWKKFPEAQKAFERRVARKLYFDEPYTCEHIGDKKEAPHASAPEVSRFYHLSQLLAWPYFVVVACYSPTS